MNIKIHNCILMLFVWIAMNLSGIKATAQCIKVVKGDTIIWIDTMQYKASPYKVRDSFQVELFLKLMGAVNSYPASTQVTKKELRDTAAHNVRTSEVSNDLMAPNYLGGDEAFNEFLSKNMHLKQGLKVLLATDNDPTGFALKVNFEKDGTVSNAIIDSEISNPGL